MYAFAPEKPPSLVGRNFCLAILPNSLFSFKFEIPISGDIIKPQPAQGDSS
jgi:hypothetical protein